MNKESDMDERQEKKSKTRLAMQKEPGETVKGTMKAIKNMRKQKAERLKTNAGKSGSEDGNMQVEKPVDKARNARQRNTSERLKMMAEVGRSEGGNKEEKSFDWDMWARCKGKSLRRGQRSKASRKVGTSGWSILSRSLQGGIEYI